MKGRLLRNTLSLYIQLTGNFILAFVQMKILTTYLTKREVGTFYGAQALGLILSGIAQFGFPMVFARFFPKYQAERREERIKDLFFLATIVYWGIVLFELPIITLLKVLINVTPLREVMLLAFFTYSIYGYLILTGRAYTGLRKMHLTALFTLATLITFNVVLFKTRKSLTVHSVLLTLLLVTLPFLLIAIIILKPIPQKLTDIKTTAKEIKSYGTYSFLVSLLSPFFMYLDRFLVAIFLPLDMAALFQIARRIELAVRQAFSVPLNVLAPEFSYLWETDTDKDQKHLKGFSSFSRIYHLMAALAFTLMMFLGKPFIRLISTREYLSAYPYMLTLLFGTLIASLFVPYMLMARSSGRMRSYFFGDLVFVVSYLILVIMLVKPFGLWGFVASWLLSYLITLVFVFKAIRGELIEKAFSDRFAISSIFFTGFMGLLWIKLGPPWALIALLPVICIEYKIIDIGEFKRDMAGLRKYGSKTGD